jgi:hypothetical protein
VLLYFIMIYISIAPASLCIEFSNWLLYHLAVRATAGRCAIYHGRQWSVSYLFLLF